MASTKSWKKMTFLCKSGWLEDELFCQNVFSLIQCLYLLLILFAGMRWRRRTVRGWTFLFISGSATPSKLAAPQAPCYLASLYSSLSPGTTSQQTFYMTRSWKGLGKNWPCGWYYMKPFCSVNTSLYILYRLLFDSFFSTPVLCYRRYVKQSQSPNSESRASASATISSCSQAPECSTSSSINASLGGCASPLSDGASCSASSSNGSNHSGTCNDANGLYDGK